MPVSAQDVKQLRELTGAGMLECRKALEESDGDMEKARVSLRNKGFADAAKKADRATAEGVIHAYIHHNERVGVLLQLNCESDFVARTDDFRNLAQQIGLQIAATGPLYVSAEDIPNGSSDDPKTVALLLQPYIRDESLTVQDLITQTISKTGENIRVRRFSRFELGQ